MDNNEKIVSSSVVAKAGIWYTVCNFLFRGLGFLTTPIFTRLMTKSDIGYFGNFTSWLSILLVLTSFDLASSIIRSKLEHADDMDSYIFSILLLTTIATLISYAVFCIFPEFFSALFDIKIQHIHIMFLYLLTVPAYNMLITKQRAYYKYKMFVVLTGIASLIATAFSIALVVLMQDKLTGRIVGHYLPFILLGAAIYIYLVFKGKRIKLEYWKYAAVLCLPLVPHNLSIHLLSSSDRIILMKLSGAEYAAIYTVASTCYSIVTILFTSLNKAWAPWLLDNLQIKNYEEIRSVSRKYVGAFVAAVTVVLLLTPEILLLLGGKKYADAVNCLPPLIASCVVQLIYTMYVNVEFFMKKTVGVSIATMIATGLNIVLNLWLIPIWPEKGFVVASYTTLIGYLALFAMHYYLVRHMEMDHVFDIRFLLGIIVGTLLVSALSIILFNNTVLRFIIFFVYLVIICMYAIKNRRAILGIFKNPGR